MLHRACFPEDPWDAGAIAQIMRHARDFSAASDGQKTLPVGFALALDLGEEAEILSLGVVPDHRRSGIGSALLDAVCVEARLRGRRMRRARSGGGQCRGDAPYTPRAALLSSDIAGITTAEQGGSVDALILRRALATASPAT